tara:strand:- start:5314 stop:6462 length:1149 start_codon:yes stop_codon:yes gene_type:complete
MSEQDKPDHGARGHDAFGPSQHKALHACAGYEGRDGTSDAAEMGTRIHEALEVRDPSALESDLEIEIYDKCIVDEDRAIADFCKGKEHQRYNELPLDVPLNAGYKTWGTADVIVICGNRAMMIDYKTGIGGIDDVRENWQGRAYTLGVFGKFPQVEEVTFGFLIPQQDPTEKWGVFPRDDEDYLRHETTNVVANATRVRAMWAMGTPPLEELTINDHCVWCRYQTHCPATLGIMLESGKVYAPKGVPATLEPGNIHDPAMIGERYTLARILEPLVEAIKKEAVGAALEGEAVGGWRLQSMGSNTKSLDNEKFVEYAKQSGISMEDILEVTNIPVAKLRDLLGKRAERGNKKGAKEDFIDAGVEAGVIGYGAERHCLKPDLDN